nr:CHC2 zinc finger domain-containing protein [Candidatus Mycoplasma haemohominis]
MKGNNHWAICPFHQDSAPSLSISQEKNLFKCFACNVAGNAIGFVMRIENCNYVSAIRKIGELLEIDISQYLNARNNELYSLYQLNSQIANAYHRYLFNKQPESQKALDYLTQERKLSIETIKKYQIGYAPSEDILQTIFEIEQSKSKISEATIKESNIFISTAGERRAYFRDRIIFPISNTEKEIIGFSGRGDEPKYLNIKNNKAFSRRTAIFNSEYLQEDKKIYIFEGFIDLLKTQQELYCTNGIACMGGIVSKEVHTVLKKYTNQIVLCFDNDLAGQSFTINIGKELLLSGFEVSVVDLLDIQEKDIDEAIDKASDKRILKEKIDNPLCFIDWIYKKNKPQNLDSTILLVDETFNMFISPQGLKQKVNNVYAKTLTNKIFEWYKNTPEYITRNLEETLNIKKEKYLTIIDQSSVAEIPTQEEETHQELPENAIENDYKEITNPFVKLTIKYQNLPKFLEKNKQTIEQENEWEYKLNPEHLIDIPEISWLISQINLSNPKLEIPENIAKYSKFSKQITSQEEFFDNYYSFYCEYLKALANFHLKDNYGDIETRFLKNRNIKEEAKKIKEISSKFFLKSKFSKKN